MSGYCRFRPDLRVRTDERASSAVCENASLVSWWSDARPERDELPWRKDRDPWHVLVAESMLSQTQTSRVARSYRAFVDAFPSPSACAAAPLGEVLRAWSGLGYNRRALNLHKSAQLICERHDGVVPGELPLLLALPGVGAYIARAVLAFSYGLDIGVLDTNIARVLARAFAGRSLRAREAQELADRLVPLGRARDWNLMLMDFGALICTARTPRCPFCPLYDRCAWRADQSATDPARGSGRAGNKQSKFAGSDRQGRGRIVRAACQGPLLASELSLIAGWPEDPRRALRIVGELVAEGVLVQSLDGRYELP